MDCVGTSSLLRHAGLRRELVMISTSGRHQHQLLYQQNPLSAFPVEEEAYVPADGGGLLCENFSVDELLDLSSGKEQNCSDEEGFLGMEEAEEEEEEEEEREASPNNGYPSSSSALSLQASPPSSELIFPAENLAELEWVSRFVDDSYSEFPSSSVPLPFLDQNGPAPAPAPSLRTAAAEREASTARLTSSRNPLKRNLGRCGFFWDSMAVPSKARSKRSRSGGPFWSLCRLPLLAESSSASCCAVSSSSSCSASSSSSISPIFLYDNFECGNPEPFLKFQQQQQQQPPQVLVKKKKNKGRKPNALAGTPAKADGSASASEEQQPRRWCTHCGVDKTPQWRAGPMGAKTLCNACGVRYKSGRLLPEYRPAGSPTFVIHLHSNSHRKVLEMRNMKELAAASGSASATSVLASCSTPPPQLAAAIQLVV